jgi:ubiquinol-cytochrome c reductase cytochrome c subunit
MVLLFGLLAAGALYTALAPRAEAEKAPSASDIEAGRQLFLVSCASCHGKNAEGVTTKNGGNYGPSLVGVGAAAVDLQVGTGRMPMAEAGPQAVRKHPEMTPEETSQVAAYIATLGPGPAIPESEYTDYESARPEQVVKGGEIFRTNCTACHNSVGAGGALPSGRFAPTLEGVEAKHIYEAMLTGPQQMPVFSDTVITPEDKKAVIAYIKAVQAEPKAGLAGGGLGPVSEGLFVWVVGIGGLIGIAVWVAAHGARSTKESHQ